MWSALLFPSLALDVFARAFTGDDHGRPFVVTSGGHYPRVVVANAAARGAGIERDQLISAALALVPDVVMRERDPRAESEALSEIATLALVYTSNVCLAPPWSIVAEVGASQLLFGGLRNLLSRLAADIQARGYMLSLGLAPTPEAALLLARAGEATPVLHRDVHRSCARPAARSTHPVYTAAAFLASPRASHASCRQRGAGLRFASADQRARDLAHRTRARCDAARARAQT